MRIVPSNEVKRREDFGAWLNLRHEHSSYRGPRLACEVGTDTGAFAVPFLESWTGRCLFCIDPWVDHLSDYEDVLNSHPREPDMLLALCALSRFTGRVRVLRGTSERMHGCVPDGLEFVYIDGNHNQEFQLADMLRFWRKLRVGGVLAGHDLNGDWATHTQWALNQFLPATNQLEDVVSSVPGEAASWYLIKGVA